MHRTGNGLVTIDTAYSGHGILKALLHNFDVDGDTPKPEHIHFLETSALPLLANLRGHIWMRGSASRTGSHEHNLALSRRRVDKVAEVLAHHGVVPGQMQLDAVGDNIEFHGIREDESARSVALLILPVATPTPIPKRQVPPPPPTTDTFKIRMLGGLNVGEGVGADALFFQIFDAKNNLSGFYLYTGRTWQVSALPTWASVTLKGDWNDFKTTGAIKVTQFAGPARFTTAGAGSYTLNYLSMYGLPPGVTVVGGTLRIQTGFTVGIGAATGLGAMVLKPAEALVGPGTP